MSDTHLDMMDVACLVTADSDQVATARLFRERFPEETIISVAPPGRKHSKGIIAHVHDRRSIRRETIEKSLFEGAAIMQEEVRIAQRPLEYAPPAR